MTKEDELAEQIAQIQKLAEENPEIDAALLIKNLMEQNNSKSVIPTGTKVRAYIVSLFFPPFGIYYVVKFFFASEEEGKKQALICFILTGLSLALTLWITNSIFSATPELEQIKNIDPQDIQELLN